MIGFFRIVSGITWGLGILSLIGGIVLRLAAQWGQAHWNASARGAVIFAAALFLCTIATRALAQQSSTQ